MLTERSSDAGTVTLGLAEGPADAGTPSVPAHGSGGRWRTRGWLLPSLRGTHSDINEFRG
jgi:hypothetical protein